MAKVYAPPDIIIQFDAPTVTALDDRHYHDATGQIDLELAHIDVPGFASIHHVGCFRVLAYFADNPSK